jgi:uncharacterized membrane protein (DUF373 family)
VSDKTSGHGVGTAWEHERDARPALPEAIPYTQVHRRLRQWLELAQDVVVVGLCVLLLALMLQTLFRLVRMAMVEHAPPTDMLSQVVLVLILTELYRTLIFYLREHRIAVSLMVEVAIVSVLRELILEGLHPFAWSRVAGISVVLLVLGALLAVDRWLDRAEQNCPPGRAH